jgi:hypothetical protein
MQITLVILKLLDLRLFVHTHYAVLVNAKKPGDQFVPMGLFNLEEDHPISWQILANVTIFSLSSHIIGEYQITVLL